MGDIPPFTPDDELDFLEEEPEAKGLAEAPPSDNRTFLYAVGALIGFMLLILLGFGVYAMMILPRQRAARQTQAAAISAQNTQIAQAITQTAQALSWTATPTATPVPTATPLPTATPVVALPTATPVMAAPAAPAGPTVDTAALGATATAVYLTQVVAAQYTPTATPAALAQTGFADRMGLPGLVGTAVLLLLLIFVVRRLRAAHTT